MRSIAPAHVAVEYDGRVTLDDALLPAQFCWTKFGTESGESVAAIRERKEQERLAGGGRFYWGIGGSVGPSVRSLLQRTPNPEVMFTPMLSRPASVDVAPARIRVWESGIGLDGEPHELIGAVVTSRQSRRSKHYALVCASDGPIDVDCPPVSFSRDSVVNLRSGTPVGSSQVTSVVRLREGVPARGAGYRVAFRARLVPPFFVTLTVETEARAPRST